jgi:3-isopropylmalate dehydrogenase
MMATVGHRKGRQSPAGWGATAARGDLGARRNDVSIRIITLPGDGIGPEILPAAQQAIAELLADVTFEEHPIGGVSIDLHGTALTDETLEACSSADAVLLAAVGGPKWDCTETGAPRPEDGLLELRKELGVFANLRPVRAFPALLDVSPLRRERIENTNLLIVRELTAGLYYGAKSRSADTALDTCVYTVDEVTRIARTAFENARVRVTSVDKANVLETSRLWRQTVNEIHAREFPEIELEHVLVDNAAMRLLWDPFEFDVLLTENMFGDILSDEAAMITGSIGLVPSASLGDGGPGLFEPVHGSAPDIVGQGKANPIAMLLSAAMLLRYGLRLPEEADALESAIDAVLTDGLRTPDLGGTATTKEVADEVLRRLDVSRHAVSPTMSRGTSS